MVTYRDTSMYTAKFKYKDENPDNEKLSYTLIYNIKIQCDCYYIRFLFTKNTILYCHNWIYKYCDINEIYVYFIVRI